MSAPSPRPASPTAEEEETAEVATPMPSIVVSAGELDSLHKLLDAGDKDPGDASGASPLVSSEYSVHGNH